MSRGTLVPDVRCCAATLLGSNFMQRMLIAAVAGMFVGLAPLSVFAETSTPAATPTPSQSSPTREARPASAKLNECRAEARNHHFGIHFIKRNRFIQSCMARP